VHSLLQRIHVSARMSIQGFGSLYSKVRARFTTLWAVLSKVDDFVTF